MTVSSEQVLRRLLRIKRRLKKKKSWGFGYLEEMTRNQAQIMINSFSEDQMVEFLLKRGFSVDEILGEAKYMQQIVRNHQTYLAKINDKHSKRKKKKKRESAD